MKDKLTRDEVYGMLGKEIDYKVLSRICALKEYLVKMKLDLYYHTTTDWHYILDQIKENSCGMICVTSVRG